MGANPAPAREGSAQAAGFLLDEGPDIGCERTELLNGSPALVDRLQRRGRHGTLTAVVEVGLVSQCWTEVPEINSVCVVSDVQNFQLPLYVSLTRFSDQCRRPLKITLISLAVRIP